MINIGRVLANRYRIDALLAEGGMGVVCVATQLQLNRRVAVKLLSQKRGKPDNEFTRRFYLEAATLARLLHPNIVTVYDYGQAESDLFIAMELLNGRSLSQVIEEDGPMPWPRIIRITIQIARALREAHQHGIIHRDLKPSNVMVVPSHEEENPEVAKVLDFGLAKLVAPDPTGKPTPLDLTDTNAMVGSPKYMAPEQIRGEPVDVRTDIYSLGAMLYAMAAGVPPFLGNSAVEIAHQHLKARVPIIKHVGYLRACPATLEEIIYQCLEKDPGERFENIGALIGELKSVLRLLSGRSRYDVDLDEDDPSALEDITSSSSYDALPSMQQMPPPPPLPPQIPQGVLDTSSVRRRRLVDISNTSASQPPVMYQAAAFAQPMHTNPAEQTYGSISPPATKRTGMFIGGGAAFAVAGAALAVFMMRAPHVEQTTAPVPAQQPASATFDEVRVTFESDPPGAKVSEAGVVIGVTPFIRSFPLEKGVDRQFAFMRDGYSEATLVTAFDRSPIRLTTRLVPGTAMAAKEPEREPQQRAQIARRPPPRPQRRAVASDSHEKEAPATPVVEEAKPSVPLLDDEKSKSVPMVE